MPDWSYQTVFRPILFLMSPAVARDLALGCMGMLSRLPWGPAVIDFIGHMRPPDRLGHVVGDVACPTRVGLGASVDPHLVATRAFAQFGIGFLEVGPLSLEPAMGGPIERDEAAESLIFHAPHESPGLDEIIRRLDEISATSIPIFGRLAATEDLDRFEREALTIIDRLGHRLSGLILQFPELPSAIGQIGRLGQQARSRGPRIILLRISPNAFESAASAITLLVERRVIDGVSVDGRLTDVVGRLHLEKSSCTETTRAVGLWRDALPSGATIMAAGGIHEPIQALDLIDAGADLIVIDSGLIFSGPGLIKRINEALLFRQPVPVEADTRPERYSWFWTCLMAVGMLIGGVLAMVIATTRVVMPYDEAMSGLTRDEILAINSRLLHFMAHDRVTLAGTMLAVGILYLSLSIYGSRRGMHWAQRAMTVSAFAGFASFFLFLGFGYFDPFHAFVTAVLFQLLIMAVHCDLPVYRNSIGPELTNDRAWWLSQWGQLIFIIHGAILIFAGCVIAGVGISTVFVPEDLEFMHTSADKLFQAHPRLVPLIAHDRATFGGMLIAVGVCVQLSSLWGFRRGHAWLWWALVTAGSVAYVATILIHWHVGYTSLHHLLPAYGGLLMIFLGGALSRSHLCGGSTAR